MRITPASAGSVPEAVARSTPSSTSARSPGVITTTPSDSRSSRFGSVIGHHEADRLAPRSSGSPAITSPRRLARPRRPSAPSTGRPPGRRRPARPAGEPATSSAASGRTRLATTATTVQSAARMAASATPTAASTSSALRASPETTHRTGSPRLTAIRALKASSPAAPTSAKSVPTTRTPSQQAASARKRATTSSSARSDRRGRRRRRPQRRLVGEVLGAAAAGGRRSGRARPAADHRAEHAEPPDPPREQALEAERDGGLARGRPAARHIEAVRGHRAGAYPWRALRSPSCIRRSQGRTARGRPGRRGWPAPGRRPAAPRRARRRPAT